LSLVIEARKGSITVPPATLLAIAVLAAERVDGVRVLRRRSIELDEPLARLTVSARRGEQLLELGRAAQNEVHDSLREMCGLEAQVEIAIGELA
jgi:uncharacterized alkaline shock family protein YloU